MNVNPYRIGYVGGVLDRAERFREDEAGLEALASEPGARWLLFENQHPLMTRDASGALRPLWITRGLLPVPDENLHLLLGLEPGGAHPAAQPRFAISGAHGSLPGELVDLRGATAALDAPEAAMLAQAASMLDWHRRHRFCASCGQPSTPARAGYQRRCTACGTEHFPRVDPVVIMLATHGERALLGRNTRFPAGFYSALAGFVEPAESLEEAVARELEEEAGVTAVSVRYVASQPWPFPSNLMLGAFAEVDGTALRLDPTEIDEALWLTRDEVRAALRGEGPIKVPPPLAIANLLLRLWAEEAAG
jgi:NAD+ diphosphatase